MVKVLRSFYDMKSKATVSHGFYRKAVLKYCPYSCERRSQFLILKKDSFSHFCFSGKSEAFFGAISFQKNSKWLLPQFFDVFCTNDIRLYRITLLYFFVNLQWQSKDRDCQFFWQPMIDTETYLEACKASTVGRFCENT